MNCSKFLLLVTKSEKVLFFCCSQLQERQFCEISVVPIQEQTERVGWFQDRFFHQFPFQVFPPNIRLQSKVSSGCSFHHHPLQPSAPESEVSHLGRELRMKWGWWAQAGKVRRQARQKCLQRWQRQKWNQTSRGKVPTKMKLFWRFRHMRTGDQAFGKSN